jgi:hypothetical protein
VRSRPTALTSIFFILYYKIVFLYARYGIGVFARIDFKVLRVLAVLVSLAPASRCTTDVVLRLAHLRLLQLILAWLAIRHRKGCGCTLCNRSGVCPSTRLCLYCSGYVRVRISSCSSSYTIIFGIIL